MASKVSSSAGHGTGADPIRVTLLRNRRAKSILYMEAVKDFVDLLFSFLTLPTGTVLKLLAESKPIGAIANIFESVKQLGNKTFYVDKDVVLDQKPFCPAVSKLNHVLQIEPANAANSGTEHTYYGCTCNSRNPAFRWPNTMYLLQTVRLPCIKVNQSVHVRLWNPPKRQHLRERLQLLDKITTTVYPTGLPFVIPITAPLPYHMQSLHRELGQNTDSWPNMNCITSGYFHSKPPYQTTIPVTTLVRVRDLQSRSGYLKVLTQAFPSYGTIASTYIDPMNPDISSRSPASLDGQDGSKFYTTCKTGHPFTNGEPSQSPLLDV